MKTKKYNYNGADYTAAELCRMFKVPQTTFSKRIRHGATIEEALTGKAVKTCPICEKQFEGKLSVVYCSKTCCNRKVHGKGKYKKIEFHTCVVCGEKFKSNHSNAKTCSKECRNYRDRITRTSRYKSLREKGLFEENVTLNNVFKKYDGKCQKCGKLLSFECSCLSDDYPSIDHIVPISKGGVHTWENVQLLCRKCNYEKGSK